MPALSPTMTHGAVAEWKVKEGQTIAAGDVLADIETDKATMALESMEDGVVARILVDSGVSAVKVGTVLGVMVEDAADAPAFATYEAPAPEATTELAPSRGELSTNPSADASNRPARTEEAADLARVWPSVRRLLAESGLDGSAISPLSSPQLGTPASAGQTLEFVRKVREKRNRRKRGVFSHQGPAGDGWRPCQPKRASRDAPGAVSYTHLTLPTILLV